MRPVVLIKLGGAVLRDASCLTAITEDVRTLRARDVPLVLVHGGGPAINAELTARGITWEFLDGLRVTTPAMMEVIEMVLCGQVNRRLVRVFNHAGLAAVGLAGTDANLLRCERANKRLGLVGTVTQVNTVFLRTIIDTQSSPESGVIPVIAPIGVGPDGEALNINADCAAGQIATALGITQMIFLTDQDGMWDADGKRLPEITTTQLEQLIRAGIVTGGMLAKARTMLDALRGGVTNLHVVHGGRIRSLLDAYDGKGSGTCLRA